MTSLRATAPTRLGRRASSVTVVALIVVGAAAVGGGGVWLASGHGAARSVASAGSARRPVGPTDRRQPIRFSLVLRLPGQHRMERFLGAVENPRSPLYHHYIDPQAFGQRYGVGAGSLERLTRTLTRSGVHVTAQYPERTEVDASAPAGTIDRLFDVEMTDYRDSRGRLFHAPDVSPRLPAALDSTVTGISGLDDQRLPVDQLVPAGGLKPTDTARAYDLVPLHQQGIEGQGQSIAIISLDGSETASDLNAYDSMYGLPPIHTHQIGVGGQPQPDSENDLDLEVIHSVAPDAQIYDYDLGSSGGVLLAPAIHQIVQTHSADIVSVSLGLCEAEFSRPTIVGDDNELAVARATGITVFVATGDAGAYSCQQVDATNTSLSVQYPSSSPNVVAVGGTSLSVAQDGSYLGESPWNDDLEHAGDGGGLSSVFARPPYQSGPGVQNQFSNGARQVPDVSADADTNTGWATVCTPCGGSDHNQELGGTSAATPFWAASMLLIQQYAHQHGVPALGWINPVLYAVAAHQSPAAGAFHDVTSGSDRYYPATPGWDFATGLGSPDVYHLAQDIVAYLKAHPAT